MVAHPADPLVAFLLKRLMTHCPRPIFGQGVKSLLVSQYGTLYPLEKLSQPSTLKTKDPTPHSPPCTFYAETLMSFPLSSKSKRLPGSCSAREGARMLGAPSIVPEVGEKQFLPRFHSRSLDMPTNMPARAQNLLTLPHNSQGDKGKPPGKPMIYRGVHMRIPAPHASALPGCATPRSRGGNYDRSRSIPSASSPSRIRWTCWRRPTGSTSSWSRRLAPAMV